MDYSKITGYEAACADQGRDPNRRPDLSMLKPGLAKFLNAAFELAVINRSLNKGEDGKVKKAVWTGKEWNHYPWFNVKGATKANPSGSGLSLYGVDHGYSFTNVSSRLTTREEEASEYSAKQFKQLWEDFILDLED